MAEASHAPQRSSSSTPAPSDGAQFPRIGRTRCYWAIFTPSLEFVSVDPILEVHMGDQAADMIGTSFFDWAHPDEVDSLRADLLESGESGPGAGLYGSVTRCRYSRVVRIKKLLGAKELYWAPEAKIYAIDDDYLALQVTTSWIALNPTTPTTAQQLGQEPSPKLGAVLAFFHACTDFDAVQDNDPSKGPERDWSNWCGPKLADGPYLTPTRCARMLGALERLACPDPPPLWTDLPPVDPQHVFQVLDHTGAAIMSSPTPTEAGRPLGTAGGALYYADELAAVVREITADPVRLQQQEAGATTSCTRRFRIDKTLQLAQGSLARIEGSIIIYGAVAFANFDISKVSQTQDVALLQGLHGAKRPLEPWNATDDHALKRARPTPEQMAASAQMTAALNQPYLGPTDALGYPPHPSQQPRGMSPYAQNVIDPALRGPALSIAPRFNASVAGDRDQALSPTVASASAILGSFNNTSNGAPPHEYERTATPPTHSAPPPQGQDQPYVTYAQPATNHNSGSFLHASQAPHHPTYGPGPNQMYNQYQLPQQGGYGYPPQQQPHYAQQQLGPAYGPPGGYPQQSQYPPHEPPQGYYNQPPRSGPSPSLSTQSLPPPPDSAASHSPSTPSAPLGGEKTIPRAKSAATTNAGTGEVVNKPGPAACESCGTANSPEWRKGPSGTKSLCNACGLRYARQVARKNRIEKAKAANGGQLPEKPKKGKKAQEKELEGDGVLDPALAGYGPGAPLEQRAPLLGAGIPQPQVPTSHPYYPPYPPVQSVVGRVYGSAERPAGEGAEQPPVNGLGAEPQGQGQGAYAYGGSNLLDAGAA